MGIPKCVIFGLLFGVLFGIAIQGLLGLEFFPRYSMTLEEMLRIFLLNSLLATVLAFGGTIFSIIEVRFHSYGRVYKTLDKTVNPLYFILKRFSPEYEKLGTLWRSLYLASFFPLVCLFLIAFVIGLFLTAFLLASQDIGFFLKLLPHISLELLAFSYAAKTGLEANKKLEKQIFRKDINSFRSEAGKLLKSGKSWKRILVVCSLLLLAAVLERIFVGF